MHVYSSILASAWPLITIIIERYCSVNRGLAAPLHVLLAIPITSSQWPSNKQRFWFILRTTSIHATYMGCCSYASMLITKCTQPSFFLRKWKSSDPLAFQHLPAELRHKVYSRIHKLRYTKTHIESNRMLPDTASSSPYTCIPSPIFHWPSVKSYPMSPWHLN